MQPLVHYSGQAVEFGYHSKETPPSFHMLESSTSELLSIVLMSTFLSWCNSLLIKLRFEIRMNTKPFGKFEIADKHWDDFTNMSKSSIM